MTERTTTYRIRCEEPDCRKLLSNPFCVFESEEEALNDARMRGCRELGCEVLCPPCLEKRNAAIKVLIAN